MLTGVAERQLKALRVFDRRKIVDEIEMQLKHQPDVETKNRKRLENADAPFEFDPPICELRVNEFRVFYDIQYDEQTVTVRRILRKRAHQTTEDVLNAADDD